MPDHEKFMCRCLELAALGRGNVSPNPMVGCVIVKDGLVVGEGYHRRYGKAHAEVNAIESVGDAEVLKHSTLYVNLEPCSHWGKTPPCADLIVQKQIPRVVIGNVDSHEKVMGQGINRLREAGVDVMTGVLHQQCRELNARFFTFHENKRPYIILKWAQTQDGFIDIASHLKTSSRGLWITNDICRKIVHQWRAHEDAILVGTRTAIDDNPSLTTREWPGSNPLRLVIDKSLKMNANSMLLDGSTPTVVFTSQYKQSFHNVSFHQMDGISALSICEYLYERNIQSLIVEGGGVLLQSFINEGLWDEARVFRGEGYFIEGVKAPELRAKPVSCDYLDGVRLSYFKNTL